MKNAVSNELYNFKPCNKITSNALDFQTHRPQAEDIAQRIWEAGIAETLIRQFIPQQYLLEQKIEPGSEDPFQVF